MAIYGVLCVVHAVAVLAPVLGSLQRRQLSFQSPQLYQRSRRSSSKLKKQNTSTSPKPSTLFAKFFSPAGLFGMESVHFDVVFQLIELIVGTSQMYQAWKLSHLVPTIWINRMYAAILVLQFWSAFLLHYFFHHRGVALYRVLCLAINVVLDFVSLTVFPVAIFLPYVRQFDPVYGDFPIFFYYEDTLFIKAVAENQQLFVMGPVDLFTKIIPAVAVLVAIFALRDCIAKAGSISGHMAQLPPSTTALSPHQAKSSRRVGPTSSTVNQQPPPMCKRKWCGKVVSMLFILCGLFSALVHLHATTVANLGSNSACYLHSRPWFSRHYTCVVLEINCEVQGHVGQQDQMELALQGLTTTVRGLVISGCPQLELPSRLQDVRGLEMLKIYNSSILKWTSDAALTATHHPTIRLLYIVHTNFSDPSTLPQGLLSDDFPESLQDIEFCGTNLVSLPPILKQKWKFVQFFVLENSPGITEFPMALVELKVPQLSLCGNQIQSIPDELLVNQSFWTLGLARNPISALPRTIGSLRDLYRIRLGASGLASIPEWMQDASAIAAQDTFRKAVDVQLGGSPVCGEATNPTTNEFFEVDCATAYAPDDWPQVYPLASEQEMRARRLATLREGST